MLQFLKQEANRAFTENGAVTCATTGSDCLDLFATIGAMRNAEEEMIQRRFQRAFAENPDVAMKILFYARDVRGGLGERRVFRTILRQLAQDAPDSVRKNAAHIAEFGRWDDLMVLMDTPCRDAVVEVIRAQLAADLRGMETGGEVSLMAKWLPSVNASSPSTVAMAKTVARALGMTDGEYRKTLVRLRERIRIIENRLRRRDYTFDYSRQPSGAMYKYRKAFLRNDGDRYREFLNRVTRGEAKLHTGVLTPQEIIAPFFSSQVSPEERRAIDVTWNAQEDFAGGENALVVVDGSGSMYWSVDPRPIAVALSLGIYFAERNTGPFRNHFITFSENPRLVEIKGADIYEKVSCCRGYNEVANTNIQKVFELILNAAVKNGVAQEEMPSTVYIISDMEFDSCTRDAKMTNFEYAKALFARHGYQLPRLVFWNVASRNEQQPVTMNEQGVALVSGCSPRVFSMLASGNLSPMGYMMDILGAERYHKITA